MKKIIPIFFALILLTGTSGVSYESAYAQVPDPKPEFYKKDTLIVKFKPGVSKQNQDAILSAQNSSVTDDLELLKIKIISVPEHSLDGVKNALSNNPNVEYAEYAEGARPSVAPNDPRYLQNDQWYLNTINAEAAWDITKGGSFPIGILDSGIDMDHPDLTSKIIHPYDAQNLSNPNINDLSNCGHGTGVAGNAAADTNNGIGIAQIGWDTQIIPIKITLDSDPDCLGWSDGVLRGVQHAVSKGAKVVNLSYGFTGGSSHIQDAADLLRANDGWLVISAGNTGGLRNAADYPYIIFVSSTDSNDNLSGFSSYGNYVDISSPGSNILLTTNGGNYGNWYGTSMAAPLAASTLNLLYSIDPTLTSDEAFAILKNTAVDLGSSGWDTKFGHGRIDAGAAAQAASGGSPSPPPSGTLNIRVNTSSDDAEQQIASGSMDLTSSDIEVGDDPGFNEDQLDGLRFTNLGVPQGATITSAYIEFTVDEIDTGSTSVTIRAQDTDNASAFTSSSNNISSRTTTSASVAWNNIPSWNSVGAKHQSPDISSVIQEVVDRSGWSSGNSMAIIIDGSGSRTSESYDGSSANAPLLHIEYNDSSSPPPLPSTPENFKVAFLGDQGLGSSSEAVLSLINSENVGMVIHLGDFDYADNPTAWNNQINAFLPGVPYFGAIGNHDVAAWGGANGYQAKLQERLDNIPGAVCTGDLGVKSSCHYQGLFFILSGVGTSGSGHTTYIENELASDDSIWSICAWHKNQRAMQVGGKSDEVGWSAYEACKDGGAIIATAHEHSYERTKTLTSTQNQIVDPAWSDPNNLRVAEGSTFAFVSGLGGQSIRDQERCTPTSYPYGCNGEWASVYTSNQGAKDGALFCEFNHNGEANKAYCYFKNTSGQTIDTFNVTSQMGVEVPPEPPVAYDQSVSTNEDTAKSITLSATDANGDPLTYSIVSNPSSGSLSGTGQTRTYTPNSGFVGNDSFTFKANDGTSDSNTATVSISVNSVPTSGILDIRVSTGSDDAEQRLDTNAVNIGSTDLELTQEAANQIVGMRFQGVNVPQGATITAAYLQFEEDTADSVSTSLTINAQDSDDANTFSTATSNISNRPTTTASVAWTPSSWGASSAKHNTPDISSVIQEVVDRPGWIAGNDMAIIVTGSGVRTAEAYEGESANAPLLHIEYDDTPTLSTPVITDVSSVEGGIQISWTQEAPAAPSYDIKIDGVDTGTQYRTSSSPQTVASGECFIVEARHIELSPNTVFLDSEEVCLEKFLEIKGDPLVESSVQFTYQVDVTGQIVKGPNANASDLISTDETSVTGLLWPTGTDDYYFTGDIISITADQHIFTYVDGVEIPNDSPPAPTPNNAPIANAGADQNVNEGNPVNLDGSASTDSDGTIATHVWTQTAGTIVTLDTTIPSQPTFTAPEVAAGGETLTFSLIVIDDDGASSTADTVDIIVADVPVPNNPPTTSGIGDYIVIEDAVDTQITLTDHFDDAEDGPSGLTYNVLSNDNPALVETSISGGSLTLSYTTNAFGEANLTIRATDSGSLTVDDTFNVQVAPDNDTPTVTINSPSNGSTFTESDSVSFSATASDVEDGDISSSIQWTSDIDGVIGSGASFNIDSLSVNTHTITAEVTDSGSISSSDVITIIIEAAPVPNNPPVADAGPDQTVVEFDPVNLDGSESFDSDGTISYVWTQTSGPGVTLSDETSAAPTFTAPEVKGKNPKTLVFELLVTDDDGASSTDIVNITVDNPPEPNNPPTADVGGPYSGTVSVEITFDGSGSSDDGTITSYDWDFGDGNTGTGVSASHTYDTTGTFNVILTVTDDKGSQDAQTTSVKVTEPSSIMIDSVSPNQIPKGTTGTVITISGSGFDNTAVVSFENGSGITPQITSTSFVNSATLTITVDVGSKGKTDSWDLRVTQGVDSAVLNKAITITK